jgi:hypothetical protein
VQLSQTGGGTASLSQTMAALSLGTLSQESFLADLLHSQSTFDPDSLGRP